MARSAYLWTVSLVVVSIHVDWYLGILSIACLHVKIVVSLPAESSFGRAFLVKIKTKWTELGNVFVGYLALEQVFVDWCDFSDFAIDVVLNADDVELVFYICRVDAYFWWGVNSDRVCRFGGKFVVWPLNKLKITMRISIGKSSWSKERRKSLMRHTLL